MLKILEKRERALGTQLSIKGARCTSPKCALIRKPHRPGAHGKGMVKRTEYGLQLLEKQKIRFSYGLTDKQLKSVFSRAEKNKESTPKAVISELESRLDNVVVRLGFALSRSISRKMVSHGHFLVNGRRVTIPSYHLKTNDVVSLRPQSRDAGAFKDVAARLKDVQVPPWLTLDKTKLEGKIVSAPKDISIPFDVNMVVDYYLR